MWSSVSGASGYNVYVDGTQIDSMLIRQYSGYMRADAVGLKAGSHTMKVVPVVGGKEDASKAAETKAKLMLMTDRLRLRERQFKRCLQ